MGPTATAGADAPRPRVDPAQHARDLAFVRRLLDGDDAALELLRERLVCVPAMVRHHDRKLGRALDAFELEEAVRDTVAAVWAKLPRFEGRSTLETWVYRFAMFEVLKAVQRKRRAPQGLEDWSGVPGREADEGPPEGPEFDARDLAAGLDSLSRPAAEVIRRRHFEGASFEAIADAVGAPVNTVKARYYRGLARLREVLERRRRRGDA